MSASKWARKSHGGSDDLKRWASIGHGDQEIRGDP